ncbi:LSU ribosomal protein L3P [Nitrosomonas sp. PY1]|uniref:50S ribosomal protein L3 n=1 Tax=Nitrosomonas sp. PY1 TaxID=1803906 RepID=UPI001FC86953|nr:50S ribosomal protein L3 [Nitrosomonas sp. PY1]GKS68803.1 LSU ribosomal protein L3P [Nitrosomonas sp. PY1]
MSLGLIGQKIGMTRIFSEAGSSLPVTVVDVSNNRVVQIRNKKNDGYNAVQLAFGENKSNRSSKPVQGHYAKAGVEIGCVLREFKIATEEELSSFVVGKLITSDIFNVGQQVDVTGITIGKGYAGVIKRHHFSSNRASHGNSKAHNKPGSIGMAQDPGRVFPGKRMSGHLGNVRRTIQNLEILKIDNARSLLLIKGAIPGHKGGRVLIKPSIKKVSVV